MSVVIRGIDKPRDCDYCHFQTDSYCHVLLSFINVEHGIDTRCPIIEINEYTMKNGHKVVVADTPQTDLVKESPSLVKALVDAFCEDGTWLERQGVYTLTLAEAKQRAVDIIETVSRKDEADTPQTDCDKCIWNVCNYNKVEWDADTPQTDCGWSKPNED